MSSSSSSTSLGLLALGGLASLAILSQRYNKGEASDSSTSNRKVLGAAKEDQATSSPEADSSAEPSAPLTITPALIVALEECLQPGNVYKTLDAAALVLRLARKLDARLQSPTVEAFYSKLIVIERAGLSRWKDFNGTKVIVIEGLSGSGKSTLIQGLTSLSAAHPVGTNFDHSPELLAAQSIFTSMPEPILKAFEFSSTYFTAYSIQQSRHQVAIVERFYHAICAHSVCDVAVNGGGDGGDFSHVHQSVFDWPVDLPVPDLVMYLAVSTDVRLKRRKLGGGTSATDRSADRILARDRRVEAAYSLITGPQTIALDAAGAPAETLAAAREACSEYSIPIEAEPSSLNSPKRVSLGVYSAWT